MATDYEYCKGAFANTENWPFPSLADPCKDCYRRTLATKRLSGEIKPPYNPNTGGVCPQRIDRYNVHKFTKEKDNG